MKDKIINLFERIALPMSNKEGGAKVDEIIKFLSENGIKSRYVPGQGILANEVSEPEKVLMAHIDLIPLFQRGFSLEPRNIYSLKVNKKGDEVIVGALDNTICNAVALLAFVKLFNEGKIPNVTLFLPEGEEVGLIGSSAYIKENLDRLQNTFFVNLDVTNEGWDKSVSIEYDRPNFEILKILQQNLENCHFTRYRVCDDTDSVNEADLAGLSFCLPTKGVIHSYKNKAKTKILEPYFNMLCQILTMELPKEIKSDFSSWYFDEALEAPFDKAKFEEYIKSRRYYSSADYSVPIMNYNDDKEAYGSYHSEGMYDDPMWFDSFLEFLYTNVYENKPSQQIQSILNFSTELFEIMASLVEFTPDDIDECIAQALVPPVLQKKFGIKSELIIERLLDFGVIEQVDKDINIYQFVPQI